MRLTPDQVTCKRDGVKSVDTTRISDPYGLRQKSLRARRMCEDRMGLRLAHSCLTEFHSRWQSQRSSYVGNHCVCRMHSSSIYSNEFVTITQNTRSTQWVLNDQTQRIITALVTTWRYRAFLLQILYYYISTKLSKFDLKNVYYLTFVYCSRSTKIIFIWGIMKILKYNIIYAQIIF